MGTRLMLVTTPLQPVQEDQVCDHCRQGRMRPLGHRLMSNPPKYPHQCDNPECKATATYLCTYPRVTYLPVTSTAPSPDDPGHPPA